MPEPSVSEAQYLVFQAAQRLAHGFLAIPPREFSRFVNSEYPELAPLIVGLMKSCSLLSEAEKRHARIIRG